MNVDEVTRLRGILGEIAQLARSAQSDSGEAPPIFRSPTDQVDPVQYQIELKPITFPDLVPLGTVKPPDPEKYKYDDDANQIKTCFVVGLSPSEALGMKDTYQDILDFVTMITGHANQKLYEKITDGSIGKSDYMTQADYRARVMQALILNTGSFLAADQMVTLSKQVDTIAVELHTALFKTLFAGIAMPEAVFPMLESLFDDLKESVLTFNKDSTVEGKHLFLFLRYFEKNELGIAEAKIRLFLFKLTGDTTKLTVAKSSYQHIRMDMDFAADQYIFNEKIYAQVRESFNTDLVEAGKKTLQNYSSVDVPV
jgi:hypothetical protein